jgi:hypothetical protein
VPQNWSGSGEEDKNFALPVIEQTAQPVAHCYTIYRCFLSFNIAVVSCLNLLQHIFAESFQYYDIVSKIP